MKKPLLFIAIAIVAFGTAQSQEFRLGAKAGVNFVVSNNSKMNINIFNYHLGAVGRIGLTEKFGIQPELLYSTQRYSYEILRYYIDYVNFAVMADYNVVGGLSLQAGPQFGFNVKKRIKQDPGDDYPGMDRNLDNVKNLSIGVGLGAQYKLPIDLFFQARYTFGLTDIYDNSNMKNGVFSLSVGYFIL